jgi:hypothetical protein
MKNRNHDDYLHRNDVDLLRETAERPEEWPVRESRRRRSGSRRKGRGNDEGTNRQRGERRGMNDLSDCSRVEGSGERIPGKLMKKLQLSKFKGS